MVAIANTRPRLVTRKTDFSQQLTSALSIGTNIIMGKMRLRHTRRDQCRPLLKIKVMRGQHRPRRGEQEESPRVMRLDI